MDNGNGPVGIIAGGQDLPLEVISALEKSGRSFFLFGLVGEADARIEAYPHIWLRWGEIGRLFSLIEEKGIREMLLIGSIVHRPNFKSTKLDLGAVKALPELLRIMASGGDEGVLGGAARFFEKRGVRIVSVPEVAPSLVVGDTLRAASGMEAHRDDIALAAKAALMIGALDAGQGVVAAEGRILAMEGPEGTDQMLERVMAIREQGRAYWDFGKKGLLLKRARPNQDLRFDMPAIGPRTVECAHRAGLAGIVCAQGEVLCVNRAQTLQRARDLGLFIQAQNLSEFAT